MDSQDARQQAAGLEEIVVAGGISQQDKGDKGIHGDGELVPSFP